MLTLVEFITPTVSDIRYIADNLRQSDLDEITASHGMDARDGIELSVELSDFCDVMVVDGLPICIFGLVITPAGEGIPWMLGTNEIKNHKKVFWEASKKTIKLMISVCNSLYNMVHAKNTISIEWLKKLGFEISPPEPHGVYGELFCRFEMRK